MSRDEAWAATGVWAITLLIIQFVICISHILNTQVTVRVELAVLVESNVGASKISS